jgi:hypothetical protein
MVSEMLKYEVTTHTYEFIQVVLVRSINEKVTRTRMPNSFPFTTPALCQRERCSMVDEQQERRIRDINGSKGHPTLLELYDLRPCFLKHYTNIWDFSKHFHHVLTHSKSERNPTKSVFCLKKDGIIFILLSYI